MGTSDSPVYHPAARAWRIGRYTFRRCAGGWEAENGEMRLGRPTLFRAAIASVKRRHRHRSPRNWPAGGNPPSPGRREGAPPLP